MKNVILITLLLISFGEAVAQRSPQDLDFNTEYVRVANHEVTSDFRILKGRIEDRNQYFNKASIIGSVKRENTHTTFIPAVPFDYETMYTLVYNENFFHFKIARTSEYKAMTINEIYPSHPEVPANILKWYVQFSRPVNPIKIYEHISFLDEDGRPIDRSILHLAAPLLSEDGMLLTIWVEPGRQKRGLGPNRYLGSVFEPFKQYTIHIADTLKDAHGATIATSVSHTFTTIESDRTKPSLSNWEVIPIKADTRLPLEIVCNDDLDYGSLLDAFSVSFNGKEIKGTLSLDSRTTKFLFTPEDKWKKGTYNIQLDYRLEDLAGNNLVHLFDRSLKEKPEEITLDKLTLSVISEKP